MNVSRIDFMTLKDEWERGTLCFLGKYKYDTP
jgi:hypothetical protein